MSTWMDAPSPPSPPSLKNFGVNASATFAMGFNATAGNLSSSSSSPPGLEMGAKFNPSMAIIIVVLLGTFFFMAFLSIYVKKCVTTEGDMEHLHIPWSGDQQQIQSSTGGMRFVHQQNVSPLQAILSQHQHRQGNQNGLDSASIQALPIVGFTKSKECCVCLFEFQENECLRLLPRCGHTFHVECIDRWLVSHTTCPLCRFKLTPDNVQSDLVALRRESELQAPVTFIPAASDNNNNPSPDSASAGTRASRFLNWVLALLPDSRRRASESRPAQTTPPGAPSGGTQVIDLEAAQHHHQPGVIPSPGNTNEVPQECVDGENSEPNASGTLFFKVWKIIRCWKAGLRSSIVRNSFFS